MNCRHKHHLQLDTSDLNHPLLRDQTLSTSQASLLDITPVRALKCSHIITVQHQTKVVTEEITIYIRQVVLVTSL